MYDNGTLIGSTTADSSGSWIFTPANAVPNGTHNITFTATKPSTGAVSASSSTWAYVVDTTVPSTPSLTRVDDHVGPAQGLGAVWPGVATDDPQATFNGNNAGASNIVKVYDNGALIGSTTADGSGNWTFTPANAVTNGTHNMTFTATNPITGAVSASSGGWAYVVDTAAARRPDAYHYRPRRPRGLYPGQHRPGGQTDDTDAYRTKARAHAGDIITVLRTAAPCSGQPRSPATAPGRSRRSSLLPYGNHARRLSLRATARSSPVSGPYPIVIGADTVTIDHLVDAGRPQGNVANGGTTDDSNPTFVGHGHPASCFTFTGRTAAKI